MHDELIKYLKEINLDGKDISNYNKSLLEAGNIGKIRHSDINKRIHKEMSEARMCSVSMYVKPATQRTFTDTQNYQD